jgi:hypothetical protein
MCAYAIAFQFRDRFGGRCPGAEVVHHDIGAALGQFSGHRPPDALGAAGNDRGLSHEIPRKLFSSSVSHYINEMKLKARHKPNR